jgi:hypothetical protein
MLKGPCFAAFLVRCLYFTLHVFHLCFVPVLFSFIILVLYLSVLRVCLSAYTRNERRTAQEQNTNGKHAECDTKVNNKKKKNNEAGSFKHMKINI